MLHLHWLCAVLVSYIEGHLEWCTSHTHLIQCGSGVWLNGHLTLSGGLPPHETEGALHIVCVCVCVWCVCVCVCVCVWVWVGTNCEELIF